VAAYSLTGNLIRNNLLTPIANVAEHARRIGQGDLREFVYARRQDEVGELQDGMEALARYLSEAAGNAELIAAGDLRLSIKPQFENDVFGASQAKMVRSMRSVLLQLAEGAQSLSSAALQMVETSRSQGASILEQASAIQEILATIEQIRATVNQASEMAGSVVEISELSLNESRAGQQALTSSTEAMHKIREQVEAIADNILDLSDKTVQIGEITASVNDIAEQSNLLAVNAAIEAARAGEAGKSFGVVATEVKNLAAQSKQATAQVRAGPAHRRELRALVQRHPRLGHGSQADCGRHSPPGGGHRANHPGDARDLERFRPQRGGRARAGRHRPDPQLAGQPDADDGQPLPHQRREVSPQDALLARIDQLAGELDQLKASLSAELPSGSLSLLRIRLDGQSAALCVSAVERVVGMARLAHVDNAPPALLGLLQLGQSFVPVLCLRRLLGLPEPTYNRSTSIVILLHAGQRRGLVVDEVEDLIEASVDRLSVADCALPYRQFLWGTLPDGRPPRGGDEPARNVLLINHLACLGA
jgi:chemotaxis signal transduction protein/HAMP domain-containing protein